jgi:hypothetical protein
MKFRVLFLDGDDILISQADVQADTSREAVNLALDEDAGFAAHEAVERGVKDVHIRTLLLDPKSS